MTHLSIPFLSQSNTPSDKAGLVVLAKLTRLQAASSESLCQADQQESGFNSDTLSQASAAGIAQLMPDIAAELGIDP